MPPSLRARKPVDYSYKCSSAVEQPPQPSKTSRTRGVAVKKAPVIDRLQALPQELRTMIFDQLSPVALFNLSLTSRGYYRALRSKKDAKSIWKVAMQREGWPALKTLSLSRPKLAHLVGGFHCSFCGRSKKDSVAYPSLLVRACPDCEAQHIVSRSQIQRSYPSVHRQTWECCRFTGWPPSYILSDVFAMSEQLYEATKKPPVPTWGGEYETALVACVARRARMLSAHQEDWSALHKLALRIEREREGKEGK